MNRTEKGLCRLGCGTGPNNRGGERRGVHRKARMLDICTAVSEGAVQEPCRSRKRSRSRAGADAAHVPPDSPVSLAGRMGGGQSLMAFEPYSRRRGLLTEACARLLTEVSAAAQKNSGPDVSGPEFSGRPELRALRSRCRYFSSAAAGRMMTFTRLPSSSTLRAMACTSALVRASTALLYSRA